MLGGSTGINLMAWDRASKSEYDAWQLFLNGSDWNFDNLLPYFIKSETIDLENSDVFPGVSAKEYATAHQQFEFDDGFKGPVHVSESRLIQEIYLISLNRPLITPFMGIWLSRSPRPGIVSK